MTDSHDHIVRFSVGKGTNYGKAKNRALPYSAFLDQFKKPIRTGEKRREYNTMSVDEQVRLKSVNGWFYRTQIDGAKRNRSSGRPTDIITLDFDYATPEFLKALLDGEFCPGMAFAIATTRRHTADNPRLRMLLPIEPPVVNENYSAVSRIVATEFDPELTMVDPVSFRPAQMMFFPTASKDVEYIFHEQRGQVWNADLVLLDFETRIGDWRDWRNLPTCPNETLRDRKEKAEKPTDKEGPVGNFCRAYDIEAAIEKFLPDLYVRADDFSAKPRYTYLKGSTTSGAVVEDDGDFLYSHHGSDPVADMLVNSFDLVRIHLFGDRDEEKDETKEISKRPSFLAMLDFIRDDPEYKRAQFERRYALTDAFTDDDVDPAEDDEEEDLIGTPPPVVDDEEDLIGTPKTVVPRHVVAVPGKRRGKVDKDWHLALEVDRGGRVLSTLANITAIIENDKRIRECFEFDEFSGQIVVRRPLRSRLPAGSFDLQNPLYGDPLNDYHLMAVRYILETQNSPDSPGWGLKVTDRDLHNAVSLAARNLPFHVVKDAVFVEEWKGKRQVETMFIDYLGCDDTPYAREAARLFMIAAVARIYEPGHKFDFVPIIEGPQGIRKSSFIETLAFGFFGNLTSDISDEKKLIEEMKGKTMMELPELSSIRRSNLEAVKSFVTRTESSYREPYARLPITVKRGCVFMGTTNEAAYLVDRTGNRRWWPLVATVDQIDTDRLKRNLPQIYAEARAMYFEMRTQHKVGHLPLFLSDEAKVIVEGIQEEKMEENEVDDYAGRIEAWLLQGTLESKFDDETPTDFRDTTCVAEIWYECIRSLKQRDRMDVLHVGQALRKLGWRQISTRTFPNHGKQKAWYPFVNGTQVSGKVWAKSRNAVTDDDGSHLI